ncbi:PGF-pre-PGF domain-containing protein [Methanolobus profundi]|uniref:PGF-pre-PGF domain-containing protein n=1 Tax=Methanolobus profundi TaxID=487685 RepID=A0A1I4QN34_9EURY|nr:PGF-pre-PGF domain-containing protein [Methanolobus profundi]SFM41457.1 PGF-pre-PGF domain-containing protein [Methanolobus profundi]
MRKILLILIVILLAVGTLPTASATASLSMGSINYDTTVVKDESITVTSTVTAASVSGTLTVDVTLTDNSGQFTVPSPTQQVQFTSDGTKSVSWTITAASTGTSSSPFTISANGDDSSSTAKIASSAITVKDRPVLTVTSDTDVSSVSAGDDVVISYVVSNSASSGAADATNVKVALSLPSGWSLSSGNTPATLGTIAPTASSSGSWTVTADSPSTSNTFTLTVTSTIPGGSVTTTESVVGPASSSSSSSASGGGGGGGGGGSTGEEYENIAFKDVKKVYVQNEVRSEYEFTEGDNPITGISFMPKVNAGYTDATIEVLHDKSTFADTKPQGKIYSQMNIWVGKTGWASSDNIEDPEISFAVDMAWIEENDIDTADIRLMRYTTQWDELDTSITGEDEEYVYFTASTPGFSPFAIVVKGLSDDATNEVSEETDQGSTDAEEVDTGSASSEDDDTKGTPGFEAPVLISMLAIAYIFSKREQ